MTSFKDREKAFEQKFANDEEVRFKITAKRNKLMGQWLADLFGYEDDQKKNYVLEVIESDLEIPGDQDIINKIKADIAEQQKDLTEQDIELKLAHFMDQAKKEFYDNNA